MNKYLLFFSLFVLFGCSQLSRLNNQYKISEKEKIANQVMKNAALRLKKEKGLLPCGTGGQMMDQVKMLMLAFEYNRPLEIEEGRELLVAAVETFVTTINDDERIHPYLYNYPFEPNNIEIQIVVRNSDFSSVKPEKISLLSVTDGNCKYDVRDSQTGLLKTIYEETFFEAQQKVATEKAM